MLERERFVVGGLLLLLGLFTFGFFVHRDPLFPGSLLGGVIGILAAAMMLVPLLYLIIKRVSLLRPSITRAVSLRSLLTIHIYAGVIAPILGVMHSGHRFESALGIWLTALLLVVPASGYLGRHLLGRLALAAGEDRSALPRLESAFRGLTVQQPGARAEGTRLVDAIADLETHAETLEGLRRLFSRWLACHTVIALLLYGLLGMHIWSAWYFGIRWLA